SIDEDVAIRLRRLYGQDVPDLVPEPDETEIEAHGVYRDEGAGETPVEGPVRVPATPLGPAPAVSARAEEAPAIAEGKPVAGEPVRPGPAAPIRPPLAGRPIHPPIGGAAVPRPEGPRAAPPQAPAPEVEGTRPAALRETPAALRETP